MLTPAPSTAGPTTAAPTSRAEADSYAAEQQDVLVVGDSYSAGYGLGADDRPWQDIVAERLGWDLDVDAVGGTGFVKDTGTDGSTAASYRERLRHLSLDQAPDVVVLQGGLNDYPYDADLVAMAVEATVETAKAQWPDARVVVFGPVAPSVQEGPRMSRLRDPIRTAALAAGADYVGPTDADRWIDADLDAAVAFDALHLNEEGHRLLARRFIAEWQREGLSSSAAAPSASTDG
nr:SGNH/GDSL hydrolase family protein [Agromyces seonyuensis]